MDVRYKILNGDCLEWLSKYSERNIHLTFVDPPFRQGKDYRFFDDNLPEEKYWDWLEEILSVIYAITVEGGAVYFMQREKNTENVLRILRETGWAFQNLIIWKKKTSAVPSEFRYSKQYQIIAFVTKGGKPRVFNKLRVDLPIPPGYKYKKRNSIGIEIDPEYVKIIEDRLNYLRSAADIINSGFSPINRKCSKKKI